MFPQYYIHSDYAVFDIKILDTTSRQATQMSVLGCSSMVAIFPTNSEVPVSECPQNCFLVTVLSEDTQMTL